MKVNEILSHEDILYLKNLSRTYLLNTDGVKIKEAGLQASLSFIDFMISKNIMPNTATYDVMEAIFNTSVLSYWDVGKIRATFAIIDLV